MFLGIKNPITIYFDGNTLVSKDCVKLLGIHIDSKLNFPKHINMICKTANGKIRQLLRLRQYMSIEQARLVVNTYIMPYFIYCPLVWMFCRKKDMSQINRVHKRALRAIYDNFSLTFEALLDLEKSVTIHPRHLQILMTETFKSLRHENPELMWDLFKLKDRPYNLRGQLLIKIPSTKTKTYGTNSLLFKASLPWNMLPNKYNGSETVNIFKEHIKNWTGKSCHCFICR